MMKRSVWSMQENLICFKRISYGTKPSGAQWLATIIKNVLVPDFDFDFCSRGELEMRYDWKVIILCSRIKMHVRKTGEYIFDLRTREIKVKPYIGAEQPDRVL